MARFDSCYTHGFARVAAAIPRLRLADPRYNAAQTVDLAERAASRHVALAVFPELGLVGYSNQDLFHQQPLIEAALEALDHVRTSTSALSTVLVVGLPLKVHHQLFNVAAVLHRGKVLGVVPKSYLPNYREFYEKRHFSAARQATVDTVSLFDDTVPFGTDLLFTADDLDDFAVSVEICEDLWVPIPPSTYAAMAGATVVANPSGSNVTVGKAGYRQELCAAHSARTISAYVYAGAGSDESTTDLAWDGHALIAENGNILAESERFSGDGSLVEADVDLDRLVADRVRMTSYVDCADDQQPLRVRRITTRFDFADTPVPLQRAVARFPFVPADTSERDERCAEVYAIQRSGLATRLRATGIKKVVLGVSGGLDSTQALLVAVRCMDDLELPRTNVLAYTLPGFATSTRTLRDAHRLMAALGVTATEIDIRPAATQMLHDLQHRAATGEPDYDRTYENVQAGARTSLLFRLANLHDGIVLGTGDLSELALGWCTYGVGDQMSHYGINGSVPKTLIQYLIRWVAGNDPAVADAREALESIAETTISPELVPRTGGADEQDVPDQRSEDVVGPYELQDFHLYYTLRFGYRPSKIAFLAQHAWGDRAQGQWPELLDPTKRNEYDLATICHWLREFIARFFGTTQFKRSALPDGPKVGSGGSLSPRGDWRAPSDATAAVWLAEIDALVASLDTVA